jgi:hypothetical protein
MLSARAGLRLPEVLGMRGVWCAGSRATKLEEGRLGSRPSRHSTLPNGQLRSTDGDRSEPLFGVHRARRVSAATVIRRHGTNPRSLAGRKIRAAPGVRKRIRNAPRGHPGRRHRSLIAAAGNAGHASAELRTLVQRFKDDREAVNRRPPWLAKRPSATALPRSPYIAGEIYCEVTSPAGRLDPAEGRGYSGPGRRLEVPLGPRRRPGRPLSPRPRMVAMADSLPPDPDDCFHCPQGDMPCPVSYQPGAWLAQPAEPTAAGQGCSHRSDEIDASIQQALRRLYEAVAGDPRRPGQPAS